MVELRIKLKTGKTLKDAATEVQSLNAYAGTAGFPRPIASNPLSETPEGFLGSVNTPPDAGGFITARVDNYDYLDLGNLPAQPQTFSFVFGAVGGSII